jgi:hypothetical protein
MPHKSIGELAKEEFNEELAELADLRCQLGDDGIESLRRLENAELRAALALDAYPVADAAAAAAAEAPEHFAQFLAMARRGQPLSHRVLMRMADVTVQKREPMPQELWDYIRWRTEHPIAASATKPWSKRERDRIVIEEMRWLTADRKYGEAAAATLLAQVMEHLCIERLGEHNIRKIWREASAIEEAVNADPAEQSLLEQVDELLGRYAAHPPQMSFEQYRAELLKLTPKVVKLPKPKS